VVQHPQGNQMVRLSSIVLIASMFAVSAAEARPVRVDGYIRRDGTYVSPSVRTVPNNSRFDNYSTQGNFNPHTGKSGTVDPYSPPPITTYRPYTAPRAQPYKAPCYFNCPK